MTFLQRALIHRRNPLEHLKETRQRRLALDPPLTLPVRLRRASTSATACLTPSLC